MNVFPWINSLLKFIDKINSDIFRFLLKIKIVYYETSFRKTNKKWDQITDTVAHVF